MDSLLKIIEQAEKKSAAVGHFNISDCVALKAIFLAAQELDLPVIIGVSEGEREFIGVKRAALMVKNLREEFNWPIFLNADHTHSLEKIKEAALAGFDAVLFDGGKLPLEENIKQTKEAVKIAKDINPEIVVEGEMGYIGGGSTMLDKIPEGAATEGGGLTDPEEAKRFVIETGVDLLAPAVGNLHGILKNAPMPKLDIERIKKIRQTTGVPLVLHGGSGLTDEDFLKAIEAGVSTIHINTEIRLAWRRGMEKSLAQKPDEVVPYKILPIAIEEIAEVVRKRLKLFNKL
mgnify:CR=1 FL=1